MFVLYILLFVLMALVGIGISVVICTKLCTVFKESHIEKDNDWGSRNELNQTNNIQTDNNLFDNSNDLNLSNIIEIMEEDAILANGVVQKDDNALDTEGMAEVETTANCNDIGTNSTDDGTRIVIPNEAAIHSDINFSLEKNVAVNINDDITVVTHSPSHDLNIDVAGGFLSTFKSKENEAGTSTYDSGGGAFSDGNTGTDVANNTLGNEGEISTFDSGGVGDTSTYDS